MDCGAGSGGKKRSQHQVRDHYFLTYTRLVHSCVCVPFRGCPVLGLCPGVGHKRRTPPRHFTGEKKTKNTPRPAPVSWDCPLHDDGWRCVLTPFLSAPLPAPLWPHPSGLTHDLWTQSCSALHCRENSPLRLSANNLNFSLLGCVSPFIFSFTGLSPFFIYFFRPFVWLPLTTWMTCAAVWAIRAL